MLEMFAGQSVNPLLLWAVAVVLLVVLLRYQPKLAGLVLVAVSLAYVAWAARGGRL